jgi:hypothetical protein
MLGMFLSIFLMVTWNIYRVPPTFARGNFPNRPQHRIDHGTICAQSDGMITQVRSDAALADRVGGICVGCVLIKLVATDVVTSLDSSDQR